MSRRIHLLVGVTQYVQMSPIQQIPAPGGSLETATRWVPVELDATATHCWPDAEVPVVASVQVIPESEDVQMSFALPGADAATKCAPVTSDAVATHRLPEDAVPFVRLVQVVPQSVDIQMSPSDPPGWLTATRCVPVESDATPYLAKLGPSSRSRGLIRPCRPERELALSPATNTKPSRFCAPAL